MTRSDSDWVIEMFAAGRRDWTPAPARQAAHVLYAPLSRDPEAIGRCASILSETELSKADRFLMNDGKANFIQRRAFRRYCGAIALQAPRALSEIVFEETGKGRPYLPDLPDFSFSFSSCRFGFLGAWSSTHRIGVDLEDKTRNLEAVELAQRYFSQAEARAVEGVGGQSRARNFFQLWSLKEAALKSIGEGLPFGLESFGFELAPTLRVVHAPREHGGPARFDAHVIDEADSCAAIVLRDGKSLLPASNASRHISTTY